MVCKNCNSQLTNQNKYCYECGAKVIQYRLTLKHIASDVTEQFFNYDNKFFKTFIQLFSKPDMVIGGYINGTRKKHINVLQYLAIALTLLGIQLFLMNTFFSEYFAPTFSEKDHQLLDMYYDEESKAKLINFFADMNEHLSLMYVLGIPISVIISWIAFLKERQYNFTEHIVLNTYITAQYVITSVFTYIIFATFSINITILVSLSLLWYVIYFGFVLYRMHKLEIGTIILRFLYSVVLYGIIIIIAAIVFGFIFYLINN